MDITLFKQRGFTKMYGRLIHLIAKGLNRKHVAEPDFVINRFWLAWQLSTAPKDTYPVHNVASLS